jgi:Lon protease-like protein
MTNPEARLPIFPLQTVLFPDGILPLRVFEARYVDMVARCLREDTVFGVNLVAQAGAPGRAAVPHVVGVSARILECDAEQPGVLQILTRGERRFLIRDIEIGPGRLLQAEVKWLDEPGPEPLPEGFEALVTLLTAIIADAGTKHFPPPHRFEDANWVGMRLASVLPIPLLARQRLLELDDTLSRLEIIRTWLEQHGLTKD